MKKKVLLFKPEAKGFFKKSPLYSVSMFGKTIALCSDYLVRNFRTPPDVATTDKYIGIFWRLHFQNSHTTLYATGREVLDAKETYLFMSNHESWMDIPAIFGAVPTSLRMISKIGLMKIPVFGNAMVNAGFIAIDRKNRSRAIKQLERAKDRLAEGISIWIAPEGTRTRDGTIGSFKKGGFYLAKELTRPIVPVFIEGAAQVMAADSITVKPNRSITVHFCKPVTAEEVMQLDSNALVTMVRERIIEKQKECLREIKEDQ